MAHNNDDDDDDDRVGAIMGGDFAARDLADGEDDFAGELTRSEALRDAEREARSAGRDDDDDDDARDARDVPRASQARTSSAAPRAGGGSCQAALRRALLTAAQNTGPVACRALSEGMQQQGVTVAVLVFGDGRRVVMR